MVATSRALVFKYLTQKCYYITAAQRYILQGYVTDMSSNSVLWGRQIWKIMALRSHYLF